MTRRLMALVGPLIALATAAPAQAGLIPAWTYRAVVQAGDGSSIPPASAVLSLGRFPTGDADGAFAWTQLPTGDSGSMAGRGTVVLAAANKGSFVLDPSLPAEAVDSFRTLLEITDTQSGARGFTYMNGRGQLVGGSAESSEVQLTGGGRVQMTLGQNRYDITWRAADSESVSRLVADVQVTSANTPEPATLALAGLGLGVVGVRRLRRRV